MLLITQRLAKCRQATVILAANPQSYRWAYNSQDSKRLRRNLRVACHLSSAPQEFSRAGNARGDAYSWGMRRNDCEYRRPRREGERCSIACEGASCARPRSIGMQPFKAVDCHAGDVQLSRQPLDRRPPLGGDATLDPIADDGRVETERFGNLRGPSESNNDRID